METETFNYLNKLKREKSLLTFFLSIKETKLDFDKTFWQH